MKSVFALVGLCFLVLMVMTGCATTKQAAVEDRLGVCAFLGQHVCSELTAGGKGQPKERWVNPEAYLTITQYNKVIVETVGFFGSKVSPQDQQALTQYLHDALTDKFGMYYPVVDQPGPGVLRVQAALLDAEAATPGARTISMVIPQLHLIGAGTSLLRQGKYPFAGTAEGAVMVKDSMTGQLLGAAVDRRVGAGALQAAVQWQWGDIRNALDAWAQMAAENLYAYTSGAKKLQ